MPSLARIRSLASALSIGLVVWCFAAGAASPGPAAADRDAASAAAGAQQAERPGAAASDADPDAAAADALFNEGKASVGQRISEAGQEARVQLSNSEHEYQRSSDRITAVRNDALTTTVIPGLLSGGGKGSPGLPVAPVVRTTQPTSADPRLPSNNVPGPIWIEFQHSSNRPPGYAHVVSMPSGIDCPPACSASFGQGVDVTIQATADPASVIQVVECYAWTAGPTTQRLPGNTLGCVWPGMDAGRGGRTVVRVNAVDVSSPPGASTGTGRGSGGSTSPSGGTVGGVVGGAGTGVTITGPVPGAGSSAGPSSASGGAAASPGFDHCTSLNGFITAKVKVAPDGFVVGWLTNNSNQTAYVQYTFARGGKPYPPETGGVTIRSGQTVGGEGGGIWAAGDADTNPPGIFWNAVLQSDADQAKRCPPEW